MTRIVYGIFGCGGFGREGIELARQTCLDVHGAADMFELVFVEDRPQLQSVDGYRVLALDEFLALDAPRRFNVLVADAQVRARVAAQCEAGGIEPFTIRSRTADIHPTAKIDVGAVLCQFTVVSANANVGRFFHLNHHGYVSHDCRVGDFVTFAPAVRCNGTIDIGDFAYLGSGATLRNGTTDRPMRIGAGAVVGMGSVVLASVEDGETVVGNPARLLKARR